MKVFGIASALLLAFSSSSVSAAGQKIRGASEVEGKEVSLEARRLADEALDFHRKLGGGGTFNAYDNGAGCNCAKGAVAHISSAHADAIQGIPMVTMAMLQAHKEDIWPAIMYENGGEQYDPLTFYKYVTELVESIVCWANCILLQIDCNQCGVDGEAPENLPEKRRKLHTDTPYQNPEISLIDCCCHVDAIAKLVVDHINGAFFKALLNPGGACIALQGMYFSLSVLVDGINKLASPFLDQYHPYECEEPKMPRMLSCNSK